MPISLKCSECGSSLKIRDDLAGRKVKCPKCTNILRVPTDEEEADVEVMPDERVSTDPPPRTKRRRDEEERPRRKESVREDRDDRPHGRRDRDDDRRDEEDE